MATPELLMGCAFAPLACNQAAIAAAEVAGGNATLGGTAFGVFGGGALAVAGGVKTVAKGGAKPPKNVEEITNPPQAPIIPSGWVSQPGKKGGEVYFPPGTDPAKGEHIRVMPPGSSAVPGYESGYWRWQNSGKQPMNPATGKPGIGPGDTHIPLPPDSLPPVRR